MSESGKQASQILPDTQEARELARRVVEAGGLIAFRTDTFYGLGADPFNHAAVARINKLKEREGKKPVLVVIGDLLEAERFFADSSELFDKLAERFWPGALTIVCRARDTVPVEITAGSSTVGLRLPADEEARAILRACGGALTATSANLAGEPPARTAQDVARYFPYQLDLIVDGGAARTDKPSTVIDISQGIVRLIREGEIARSKLDSALKTLHVKLDEDG